MDDRVDDEKHGDLKKIAELMYGIRFLPSGSEEVQHLVREEGYCLLPREQGGILYKMVLLANCEWAYNVEWEGPPPAAREELLPRIHQLRNDLGFEPFVPRYKS